ncbi:MAG: 5' nucleotidase, NT5C type [Bacillota bacterium]
MNIGIDIDGVITNEKQGQENIWLRSLNNYFENKITRKKNVYNFSEAYDIPLEDLRDFINNKIHEVYSTVDVYPNAKNIIDKIRENGHLVYLITARHKEFRPLTIKWLEQHNINYDYLFHEDQKANLAVEKNIKLFIEDNQSNTISIVKKGIPVILMDKYHNRELKENKDVYRVHNWKQIDKLLYKKFNIFHK